MSVKTFEHNTNQIWLLVKERPTIIHHNSAVISPSEGPSSSLKALTKETQNGTKLALIPLPNFHPQGPLSTPVPRLVTLHVSPHVSNGINSLIS